MFTPEPVQRRGGPPASSNPVRDYLGSRPPGAVDAGYAVLPRSLMEAMPLPWQQQMVHLLAELHRTHGHLRWPEYRVVPSRRERLVDLDEDQLTEVGAIMEIDSEGELVYRERGGRPIEHPENHVVLVSCLDPVVREAADQTTPPRGFPQPHQDHGGPHPGALPVQDFRDQQDRTGPRSDRFPVQNQVGPRSGGFPAQDQASGYHPAPQQGGYAQPHPQHAPGQGYPQPEEAGRKKKKRFW
ncbi:hypothetical protein [Actinosynnema mirum]|uniref:Uncharacterized protein n=1 Tax=Actinosynnema mirum (strain ATCC 29888 / DSM 43827 / JCM 3225 / NBRC 14064 / NCIMB 13271 / NRRL B-12336 / IMRU 3971 / 101) TaxID=446462 RepID=C6WMB7_ACTMD|nr:hypothetical protein [Actinosynnema mirum]ACU34851.1 hypothetical protein Amir_0890 [Actinosynnema mirum DSM 43827]AXX28216.1 hypothetical protein APASM_0851 [Actinosynnema pretiosum subsp. pretiosum]